jgi:hypothetical protein
MNTTLFVKSILISLLIAGLFNPLAAQEGKEMQNLYKTASKKQTKILSRRLIRSKPASAP